MDARLVICVGVLLLAGCASDGAPAPTATVAAPAPTAAFRTTDFAWSTAPGKGQIQGQLAYKPSGVAYSCVGAGVVATPETPWVRARMTILYRTPDGAALPAEEVRGRTPPERNQDYSNFVKRAACDATGQFTFSGLADGAWYVITVARPVQAGTGRDMAMMHRVVIKGGAPAKVRF